MRHLILCACLACVLMSGCATTRGTSQPDSASASQTVTPATERLVELKREFALLGA